MAKPKYNSIDELPGEVKKLPTEAAQLWMKFYNRRYEQYKNDYRAIKGAWAMVKRFWTLSGGKWVLRHTGGQTYYRWYLSENFTSKSQLPEPVVDAENMTIKGLEVMRATEVTDRDMLLSDGDFADMVENYNYLKKSGTFKDVPMRLDHGRSVRDIAGYLDNLYTDETGQHLLADVSFTSVDAFKLFQEGTIRNRSAEMGAVYENDGAEHYPVFRGFAWVDIPAIQKMKPVSNLAELEDDRVLSVVFGEDGKVGFYHDSDGEDQGVREDGHPLAQVSVDEDGKNSSTKKEEMKGAKKMEPIELKIGDTVYKFADQDTADAFTSMNSSLVKTSELLEKAQADIKELQEKDRANEQARRKTLLDAALTEGCLNKTMHEKYLVLAGKLSDEDWKDQEEILSALPKIVEKGKDFSAGGPTEEQKTAEVQAEIVRLENVLKAAKHNGMTEARIQEKPEYKRLMELKGEGGAK